jgi:hypothetical protein
MELRALALELGIRLALDSDGDDGHMLPFGFLEHHERKSSLTGDEPEFWGESLLAAQEWITKPRRLSPPP